MQMIAFDSHKRYTLASVEGRNGRIVTEERIKHVRGNLAGFLAQYESGSPVAVETIGNWYWIVDEIEAAGMQPRLVHARKAKLMLGSINKTDKLDVRGLNKLQRTGTLPTVWIPPGELRDGRELPRTRMIIARQRTRLKNRIHSILDKYGLQDELEQISDIFGRKGRACVEKCMEQLPAPTRYMAELLLGQLELMEDQIGLIEKRMKELFAETETVKRLMSMPGVGFILAVVISQEIGDIRRFASAERLASYAGVTPRVHASGDKVRFGRLRSDTNHYLKWAYSEAGNSVAVNRDCWPARHVSMLYYRLRARKGHAKAVGAVARHLAEATYWMLRKRQGYLEPRYRKVLSTGA